MLREDFPLVSLMFAYSNGSNLFRGISAYDNTSRNVLYDHGTRGDDRAFADIYAFQNDCARADNDIILNDDRRSLGSSMHSSHVGIHRVRVRIQNESSGADHDAVPNLHILFRGDAAPADSHVVPQFHQRVVTPGADDRGLRNSNRIAATNAVSRKALPNANSCPAATNAKCRASVQTPSRLPAHTLRCAPIPSHGCGDPISDPQPTPIDSPHCCVTRKTPRPI